jgi:hypothetical protein
VAWVVSCLWVAGHVVGGLLADVRVEDEGLLQGGEEDRVGSSEVCQRVAASREVVAAAELTRLR